MSKRIEPSERQLNDACLSFRHDFGLLPVEERETVKFQAREWLIAWQKSIPAHFHDHEDDLSAMMPLVTIANAFDANELDDEARKFWGKNYEHENVRDPDTIELYTGRGGKRLLTLGDCLRARKFYRNKFGE